MKKVISLIMLLSILVSPGFVFSQSEEPVEKKLSLKDAIFQGLKNNLDLQIQKTDTEYAQKTLRINKTIFIPNLSLEFNVGETNSPASDFLSGATVNKGESLSLSLTLSQRIPLGGNLGFTLYNLRSETNSKFSSINPSITSKATLALNQPLLKGFGNIATKYQIYIAANDYKISRHQLEQNIIDLVYNVESAYWELVYAYQSLDAAKMALERAKDLLKQNQVKEKVGTIAPIDVLSSKAQVARNESTVISAERTIQIREETLKSILNMSKENVTIVPTDTPEIKSVPVDFNGFLLEALENRPDINRYKKDLKNYNIRVKYARNQALPDLQLSINYYTWGLGGDQFIYAPDASPLDPNFNPDTDILGVIQRSLGDSLKDVFSLLYKNYSVSLNLTMPLSFAREKAELAQAKINLKRALLNLKKAENDVYYNVKDVIKELESNRKLVEAEKVAMQLVGENLRAEEKKLSVGLSTNFNVQEYQRQLADAETSYLRSVINYSLSLAKLNQVLARTFKAHDIKLADYYKEK
jgi:outer membrane protein TolC